MRETKQTIIQQAGGCIFVKYPHFKSRHLYLAFKEHPIHCCQCDSDIPANGEALIEHIKSHSQRKNHRFLVALAPDLISGSVQFGELVEAKH